MSHPVLSDMLYAEVHAISHDIWLDLLNVELQGCQDKIFVEIFAFLGIHKCCAMRVGMCRYPQGCRVPL